MEIPYDLAREFDEWLNARIDQGDVYLEDLCFILTSILARMRMFLTFEELGTLVATLAAHMEDSVQRGKGMLDPDTMEPRTMVLAEESRVGITAFSSPDVVPEEWTDELA